MSEAGWNIDSGKVFRLDSLIPHAGVSIVSKTDPENADLPPLPPHLGRWHPMSESEVTLHFAFRSIRIPVDGSSEKDLPEGTVGVYFGPEPENLLPISTSERDTWKTQKQLSNTK